MVGITRYLKSTACHNCKLKRTKCDQNWPTCTQCIRKGVRCPGPSSLVKFVPAAQSPAVGSSSVPESAEPLQSARMVNRGPMRPYGDGGAMEVRFRLQLPRPLMSTAADRVGMQLVGLYDKRETSAFGGPSYLEFCPPRLSQSSCLVDCVAIYCASWVQANRGRPAIDVLKSNLFKKAIRSLQSATDSKDVYTPETLASMVLFARVLSSTGEYAHDELRDHHLGIRHVAKQMGLPNEGDSLHKSLIFETLDATPVTVGVNTNVQESPWKEQEVLGNSPFWEKDSEGEEEEGVEVDWETPDEIITEYNGQNTAEDALEVADSKFEDVVDHLTRIWLPELLEIWTNPLETKEKTTLLMKKISKAERIFGKSVKNAWRACLSAGFILKFQDPNFFLGHSYSLGEYKVTAMFLGMLLYQSFLVRILYEFNQLLGVRDEALYGRYRDLCVRIWACVPSFSKLDPVSALRLFKFVLPSFEPTTDEELRHILNLNIELSGHGATGNADIQKLRLIIIMVGKKYTGREDFKALLDEN